MSKTHKMIMIGILSAISFLLMLVSFAIIPGAAFLKIEFSIIPVLFDFVIEVLIETLFEQSWS